MQKGYFPYRFININNLDYIGLTPDFSLFEDLTREEHDNLIINNWDLKSETIKYCIQDCVSLYQIIQKFNSLIYDSYQLNINNYPTLPSLAFGIYRSNYLKDFKIPLIKGQIFHDIRKG